MRLYEGVYISYGEPFVRQERRRRKKGGVNVRNTLAIPIYLTWKYYGKKWHRRLYTTIRLFNVDKGTITKEFYKFVQTLDHLRPITEQEGT